MAAVYYYGDYKYDQGYEIYQVRAQAAQAELLAEYRKKEQAEREYSEAQYAKYMDEKAKTDAANRELVATADSLRNAVAVHKRRLSQATECPASIVATCTVGIDNYQACNDEYISMGGEFAATADRLNALIAQCVR